MYIMNYKFIQYTPFEMIYISHEQESKHTYSGVSDGVLGPFGVINWDTHIKSLKFIRSLNLTFLI